ncbi:unnamed protein product, partial [Ectocarpus fasciculatus]
LCGRWRAGEDVSAAVEAVLRWCWTVTGGRRLAHVVLIAPQSLAVDGSLVRAKGFLNDGRLAPGMMRVIALNAPDSSVIERRFRSRFATSPQQRVPQGGGGEDGERAVTLCMELVHREGCAVAEEANEILTRTDFSDDSPGKLSAARLALEESLDGFALEAWRRVGAAVESVESTAAIAPRGSAGAAAIVDTADAVSSAAPASNARAAPVPPSMSTGGSSAAAPATVNAQGEGAGLGVTRTRISPESGGGCDDDAAGGGEERGLQTAERDVDDGAAVGAGPGDDKAESDVPDSLSASAAVVPNDGKKGHAESSTEVEATPKELHQQQEGSLQDEGMEPPAAYDLTADEPASLEAAELSSEPSPSSSGEEEQEEAVYSEEAESLSAPVVAEDSLSSSSAVAAGYAAEEASEAPVCSPADPATPVGKLVELLGELADGGKVTVQHAVASLDGDGKALARLLDLGVLRLCPQTRSSSVGAGRIDRSTVRGGGRGRASILSSLSLTLPVSSLDASHPHPWRGSTSPDVLAEAGAAFEVGLLQYCITGI